jgi:thiol-disulfide isomerase/thioredoxin
MKSTHMKQIRDSSRFRHWLGASLGCSALCALWLAGAQVACAQNHGTLTPAADAVEKLWASTLPDTHGIAQPLARYRHQRVVVNFWASWCGPCVRELPQLSALSRQYAAKNIQFIGIGVDSAANVKQFLAKTTVSYPVYIAGFGGTDLTHGLGNRTGGLPFTVVIDAAGSIRYRKLGSIDSQILRRVLAGL